ncbi:uncharacterized protein PODANS_2_4448 [Podospora anserina S mat+]|uniref:Podospora anserina S mat+ genomic DNA chromosome 2, supercontig 2 n=1 Tax=Podospora anserina (strain S / ATCC MYA-4624 / DSM 980 / FGSC 10383) TaxID=515849 RepID=B2B5E9_PODAN|nr:uncharacterized protein PODANS_2_4448 [Podospora anserina S mat+]CAP73024.1 unnamed protein product [Podospora anserina S mat+]CDP25424.1 Putative protein of unknown function [Podospora anserina S mat+]
MSGTPAPGRPPAPAGLFLFSLSSIPLRFITPPTPSDLPPTRLHQVPPAATMTKSPSTLSCSRAPGPNTCHPCLESFRRGQDEARCIEDLFADAEKVCRREHPHPSGVNLFASDCVTKACLESKEGCIPIVLCPKTEPDDETVVPELEKNLVGLVAKLLAEFLVTTRLTIESEGQGGAPADEVHRRRMLAATRNPLPSEENADCEVVRAVRKRQELRLLPKDLGFSGWQIAKRAFFEGIRKFLCRPELEPGFDVLVDEPIRSGEAHEEDVKAFREEYFPL